jgi:hypothetical protein
MEPTVAGNWSAGRGIGALLLVVSCIVIGAAAGGAIAAMTSTSTMGFDQLNSTLSGIFLGVIAGLTCAILLIRKLGQQRFGLFVMGATVVAAALVGWGTIRAGRDMARAESATTSPTPATPTAVPR